MSKVWQVILLSFIFYSSFIYLHLQLYLVRSDMVEAKVLYVCPACSTIMSILHTSYCFLNSKSSEIIIIFVLFDIFCCQPVTNGFLLPTFFPWQQLNFCSVVARRHCLTQRHHARGHWVTACAYVTNVVTANTHCTK